MWWQASIDITSCLINIINTLTLVCLFIAGLYVPGTSPAVLFPILEVAFIPVAINASFAFLQRFRQKKNVISRFPLPARLFLICIYLQPYCLAKYPWRPQRCFIAASAQDHRVLKPSLTSKSEPSSSRPGVKTKLRRSFLRRGRQKCAANKSRLIGEEDFTRRPITNIVVVNAFLSMEGI